MKKLFPETLTRLQYLLRVIIFFDVFLIGPFVFFGIAAGIQVAAGIKSNMPMNVALVVMALFVIFLLICRIQMDFARLRSLGWSRWCVLLLLVPVANLVLVIFLFFGPPVYDTSDDSNRGSRTGRVLIWLAAALVIPVTMGVLIAAIAIPNFIQAKAAYQKRMASMKTKTASNTGSGGTIAAAPATGNSSVSISAQPASPAEAQAGVAHASAPGTGALRVDSIFYYPKDASRSSAVINGNSVMADDTVGNWRVTIISSNAVTLQNKDGETQVLRGN